MDLVSLAEDVKLSANGRQPTLPTLLMWNLYITNTSPVEFIYICLLYSWNNALFFNTGILALKFGGVQPASFFSFHPILYLYLHIGDNVSFKFGGGKNILLSCWRYCDCMIMYF
jgi:hypothetical protein